MAEQFKWIDFYTEFATKLLDYEHNRDDLIIKIEDAFEACGMKLPKLEDDGIPIDIDPFTVFALFNKKLTDNNRISILKSIKEEFSIQADIPVSFIGIPILPPLNSSFYGFGDDRNEKDIDNLWSIFRFAIEWADDANEQSRSYFGVMYDPVIAQNRVSWNITMGLYWIRPYSFLNLDSRNRDFMSNPENVGANIASLVKPLRKVPDAGTYMRIIDKCLEEFESGKYPFRSFPELSYMAWKISKEEEEDVKTDIDFIGVLDYLEQNQEVPYSNPDAPGISSDEKARLNEVKRKGQYVAGELKKMAEACSETYMLDKCLPISWLDGSNTKTRKYLWAQMKYSEYENDPTSISIFVEGNGEEGTRYRISLEIKNDGTDRRTMERYHSYLDLPIPKQSGLVLVAGSNQWGNPKALDEPQDTVKDKVQNKEIRKVQLCKYIERSNDESNDKYNEALLEAVGQLIPYYEHVIGKAASGTSKKTWLLTWNPANWEWEDYEECSLASKNGEPYRIPWASISKKPQIGDECYLMKTGEPPRGIVAHGHVVRESYQGPHFDDDKAAEGVESNYIDVEFDRIQNYRVDRILEQAILKQEIPAQTWSPQASGIEIKESGVSKLESLWEEVTGGIMKETSDFSLNTILYGPPGTGKTYNTVKYAVSICDGVDVKELTDYDAALERFDELKREGRVAFTTFHQSYGYEEFIEGIKPQTDGETRQITYEIEDGIFKEFCTRAIKPQDEKINYNSTVFVVRLAQNGKNDLKDKCFQTNTIRFDWPEDCSSDWMKWLKEMRPGDFVVSYFGESRYIDGIGIVRDEEPVYDESFDSYRWKRTVEWLVANRKMDILPLNNGKYLSNFHVGRVPGVRVSSLMSLVNQANGQEDVVQSKPYVFIIDEINRGNISKLFGELITLIEETKRIGAKEQMKATLPYSHDMFGVPKNVYILGTMNTADRSIAIMDTALRRRFDFIEMMPEPDVLSGLSVTKDGKTVNIARMLRTINERIEYLYDREHTIGHAFFIKLGKDNSLECLASIFRTNVVPLLQEYFYDDYEKIQLVLGDNDKSEPEYKFVLDEELGKKPVFKGSVNVDLPEKKYSIQDKAFDKIESYIEIM